ncbi:MAG: PaaI family thioesterase [Acidimicrobiales bacterium]
MSIDHTAMIHTAMPLCASLGITADRVDAAAAVLALDWQEALCTSNGLLHGGALMALADSAGGACAFANLPADASATATIESKTNLFGAVRCGQVIAFARPVHVGSTTIVIETDLTCDGAFVAKTIQTQLVLR